MALDEVGVVEALALRVVDLVEAVDVELPDEAAEVGVLEVAREDLRGELDGLEDDKARAVRLVAPADLRVRRGGRTRSRELSSFTSS